MRAANPPWNGKTNITALRLPPMYRKKPWKKWTATHWFAHKAYSAAIPGGIRLCMECLENWWLSESEIRLVAFPYMSPLHFVIRFLMFHLLFPQLLWVFPMIPLKFPPVYYFRSYAFHVHCSSYYLNLVTICKDTAIRNVLNKQKFLCFLGIA